MRVYLVKVLPDPTEPQKFASGYAEEVTKDGAKLKLHNCQSVISFAFGPQRKPKTISFGDVRVARAILARVPAPRWFTRQTNLDPLPLHDQTRSSLLSGVIA